jgi:hypothetical protein
MTLIDGSKLNTFAVIKKFYFCLTRDMVGKTK